MTTCFGCTLVCTAKGRFLAWHCWHIWSVTWHAGCNFEWSAPRSSSPHADLSTTVRTLEREQSKQQYLQILRNWMLKTQVINFTNAPIQRRSHKTTKFSPKLRLPASIELMPRSRFSRWGCMMEFTWYHLFRAREIQQSSDAWHIPATEGDTWVSLPSYLWLHSCSWH